MALSPNQIIETVCPELAGSPSLPVYLAMAVETTDKGFFGKLYPYAIAYMACHLFTTLGDSEGGGGSGDPTAGVFPISSKSEGGLSVTYAVPSNTDDSSDLDGSKYGKLYLALRKRIPRLNVNRNGVLPGRFL